MSRKLFTVLSLSLPTIAISTSARAQFTVQGVEDKEVYADRVSFEVQTEPGYDYTVLLNGEAVETDLLVDVDEPEYYELFVESREQASGAEQSLLVQFIVRSSERRNSEWGLPPWVPFAMVPSAAAEFEGARLEIVTPHSFPHGLEIPVIARVFGGNGKRLGVNGMVEAEEHSGHALRLIRGVGSAFLPPASSGGLMDYTARIGGLEAPKQIAIEEATDWTDVSGALDTSVDWGEDARIHVTADLTVAAGATLTIGAGSVIQLDSEVEIHVDGSLVINGTLERPAVFTPVDRDSPWGGFVFWSSPAQATVEGAIFTGSGAREDWFDETADSGSSHRDNQCLFYLREGARATLTDCFLVDHKGQAGHGEDAYLTMTRCLVQKFVTAGQYNDGRVVLEDSALIEFPAWDAPFADDDNDGIYLNGATAEEPHSLRNCLFGWALDDAIDAGSGAGGAVEVVGCWIESAYHEGMAFSNDRLCNVSDTVAINCGQGIECGFDDPLVTADRCLSTANVVGARFGDNYDWDYEGFLTVTNSLLLYNKRDVWGRNWDDWTVRLDQMEIQGNFLSVAEPDFPENAVWQPEVDAVRLLPFLPTPADTVGVGLTVLQDVMESDALPQGIPVRLSTFTAHTVSVEYTVESDSVSVGSGTVTFAPGETVKTIELATVLADHSPVRVTLANPVGADITGRQDVEVARSIPRIPVTLLAAGSVWKYHDEGEDLGTAWRLPGYDDNSWKEGPAELGYGDDDEATVISFGTDPDNKFPTAYFRKRLEQLDPGRIESLELRLKRDDGAVVYFNGVEVYRTNMPDGDIEYSSAADGTTGSEDEFHSETLSPDVLVAGANVIAVEVHQAEPDSSDLSFDLELRGLRLGSLVPEFRRADANADGASNISDAVTILLYLFLGNSLGCIDAADVDDNGSIEITDPIRLLTFLYLGGPPPVAPVDACGPDPSGDDELSCESFAPCP